MNIAEILVEMEKKAKAALTEADGNRPADQATGDSTVAPGPIADPAGGANGQGGSTARPADNISQKDPAPGATEIEEVQPANQIPDPSATGLKTVGKGATTLEPGKLAEAFAAHLNDGLKESTIDIKEKAKPILEGLELDEQFSAKALELFEGTINESVKSHLTVINGKAAGLFEHLFTEQVKLMEEKSDAHLNAVITEWVQENKLAIEQGIRTQIAESFMDKLKGLLESHYVELPAGKKDLYEAAIQKGDEILEQYNAEREKAVGLSEEVAKLQRKLVLAEATAGLVATKAEKVREMAESIKFDDNFKGAVAALVEEVNKPAAKPAAGQHVAQDPVPLNESVETKPAPKAVDPMVSAATRFLGAAKK